MISDNVIEELLNKCNEQYKELCKKYPNDQDLGRKLRKYINIIKKNDKIK